MADPLSIAGSVVGIAAAGIKVSISLFALAETVSTASDRVDSIANDVSSTCGILNQLRDLITLQCGPNGSHTSVFNSTALSDISSAMHHCRSIFNQINKYLKRATKQVKDFATLSKMKIKLSRSEQAKWPFLQPQFHELRNDLRDSKSNLLLMVAVANLAVMQRTGLGRRIDERDKTDMRANIVRLQRAVTLDAASLEDQSEEEKDNAIKSLFQKMRFWRSKKSADDMDDDVVEIRGNSANLPARIRVTSVEVISEHSLPIQAAAGATEATSQNRPASPASVHETNNPFRSTNNPFHQTDVNPFSPGRMSPEALLVNTPIGHYDDSTQLNAARPATPRSDSAEKVIEVGNEDGAALLFADGSVAGGVEQEGREHSPATSIMSTADVPAHVLPGIDGTRSHQPTDSSPAPGRESSVSASGMDADIGLGEGEQLQHKGPREEQTFFETEGIEVTRSTSNSPGTRLKEVQEVLQAWTTGVLPGLHSGSGASLACVELSLPETDIFDLIEKQDARCNLLETLEKLNTYQRNLVLAHTSLGGAKLLYVNVWRNESIPTVFGLLEVVTLIWITASTERRKGRVDVETLFRREPETMRSQAWTSNADMHEPETTDYAEEPAKTDPRGKSSKEDDLPDEEKKPIKFKDAVGRRFSFPYHMVKTWDGMESLIKQAFLHVDVIGPHVHDGHYDLVDSDGQIVLPQTWQFMVRPDWDVVMHMWPMPEPSPPPPSPPPPPPGELGIGNHIPQVPKMMMPSFLGPPPPPSPPQFDLPDNDDDSDDLRVKRRRKPVPTSLSGRKIPASAKKTRKKLPQFLLGNDKKGDEIIDQLLLKWIVTD